MNEEIDIIDLFSRLYEGKAPQRIKIESFEYEFLADKGKYYRKVGDCTTWIALTEDYSFYDLTTVKIKILDKPIIEELQDKMDTHKDEIIDKINEIIRRINKEEK